MSESYLAAVALRAADAAEPVHKVGGEGHRVADAAEHVEDRLARATRCRRPQPP